MKKLIVLFILLTLLPSCSVYMAATQPDKKNLSVLHKGTPRSIVIGTLGQPNNTEREHGNRKDYFEFVQGYDDKTKIIRVVTHAGLDFFTGLLWEVVGTPVELAANGTKITLEIFYNANDRVEVVKMFTKGKQTTIVN